MLHRDLRPWRNHTHAARTAARHAFTLAELLIVIAIIGVLISILLPTLGSARRSANSAKCLAALRDLGLAYQMYAQDNKRAFPVVEYAPPSSQLIPGSSPRRSWQDFLVKYLHKKDPTAPDPALDQYRPNSVLWGCPSFDADNWWQNLDAPTGSFGATTPNRFNTGYAMSRWALAPYSAADPLPAGHTKQINGTFSPVVQGNMAIIRETAPLNGAFIKMEQWGKRGAERGLLADSNSYDLIGAAVWSRSAKEGTGSTDKRCDPFITGNPSGQSYINVDGARHVAPTNNVKKIMNSKGVNMLFVDGHAAPVTPEEAWIATRGGGMDVRSQ